MLSSINPKKSFNTTVITYQITGVIAEEQYQKKN